MFPSIKRSGLQRHSLKQLFLTYRGVLDSDYLCLCIGVSLQERELKKNQSLRHASDQQSSNALFLAPYRYLRCYTALRRKGHLHQSCDFASTESLAIQLEGVRAS